MDDHGPSCKSDTDSDFWFACDLLLFGLSNLLKNRINWLLTMLQWFQWFSHLTFSHSSDRPRKQVKTAFWQHLPWRLFGMAVDDEEVARGVARSCIAAFEIDSTEPISSSLAKFNRDWGGDFEEHQTAITTYGKTHYLESWVLRESLRKSWSLEYLVSRNLWCVICGSFSFLSFRLGLAPARLG